MAHASAAQPANRGTLQRGAAGVTCVRSGRQGVGCVGSSGPWVLVKVERPQRSEDERP
jgi:hypothetical protein